METLLTHYLGDHYANVIFTNVFGILILIFLYYSCFRLSEGNKRSQIIYALCCIIGLLLGWGVAIYFTPFKSEQNQLATLGQAASAFVSGYLVSKIDRFIEATLFPKENIARNEWLCVALFTAAFLTALTVVYSNRTYFQEISKSNTPSNSQNSTAKEDGSKKDQVIK